MGGGCQRGWLTAFNAEEQTRVGQPTADNDGGQMFRSLKGSTGRHFKGASQRRRQTFRKALHSTLAGTASLALVASGMVAGLVSGAAPAQADYATAGSGPYQSRIYWFDMTGFPLDTIGGSKTFSPAPGMSASVTMSAKSAISGTSTALKAQSLSSYSGGPGLRAGR